MEHNNTKNLYVNKYNQGKSTNFICPRCLQIPFNKVNPQNLGNRRWRKSSFKIGTISDAVTDPSCQCCEMLSLLCNQYTKRSQSHVRDSGANIYLLSFNTSTIYLGYRGKSPVLGSDDTVSIVLAYEDVITNHTNYVGSIPFWEIADHGYLSPTIKSNSEMKFGARQIHPFVDFGLLKYWLDYCCQNHASICHADAKSPLHKFKVIDCRTRQIVSVTSTTPFVALSYVWGKSISSEENSVDPESLILPAKLPNTIEDAIIVTQKLGFSFLWVDRYCIPQDDCAERHMQIQQMDRVYFNAEVTIVAAAGEDPTFGLPGAHYRPREQQPSMVVGGVDFILVPPHPRSENARCRWSSRAWTYQEAVFSRRRLLFFENQVYFECSGMQCLEAIQFPLDVIMNIKSRKSSQSFHQQALFSSIKKMQYPLDETFSHLSLYTARNLSFPGDILNGISGVFGAFERTYPEFLHLQGIPIVPDVTLVNYNGPIRKPTRDEQLLTGLCWKSQATCQRRSGFPSWSWAGWYGNVEPLSKYAGYVYNTHNTQIHLELPNGNLISLESYLSSLEAVENNWRQPVQLIIDANIVVVRLRYGGNKTSRHTWQAFLEADGLTVPCKSFSMTLHMDAKETMEPGLLQRGFMGPYYGIVLGIRMGVHYSGTPSLRTLLSEDPFFKGGDRGHSLIVLVIQEQDSNWQRLGLIELELRDIGPDIRHLLRDSGRKRTVRLH